MSVPLRINDDAARCWFQDKRARIDADSQTLVAGSVAAPEGSSDGVADSGPRLTVSGAVIFIGGLLV